MSETRKLRKKKASESDSTETLNLVSDFIDQNEPKQKKIKKSCTVEADLDDSLKFFKTIKTKVAKASSEPSTSSNVASTFIDEPSTSKKPSQAPKSRGKITKRKPKTQPDIRKVLTKQEQLFHHVVNVNCLEEGIDPDEMQMALAISESLKDQNQLKDEEDTTTKFTNPFASSLGNVKSISAKLEKFGFKCKKNYSEYELDLITNSKVSKRSKFQKFPTVLTRTSNQKRLKIIGLKIDRILEDSKSQDSVQFDEDSKFSFKVFSCFLQDFQDLSGSVFDISRDDRPADESLLSYYVTDLFEPSFVKSGHLLKDWSKIPGRDPSPNRDFASVDNEKVSEKFEDSKQQEEAQNLSRTSSCMDLFAEDEELDQETSGGLAGNLSLLHDKLSQSIAEIFVPAVEEVEENSLEVEEVENLEDSIARLENFILEKVDSTQPEAEETDLTQPEAEQIEEIDLTQAGASFDREVTIPFDDSYHTLKQHMKQVLGSSQAPSVVHIDLLSSEEDEKASQDNLKDESMEEDSIDQMFSQSSTVDDDDIIEVSDEEINYSMGKYLQNNDEDSRNNEEDSREVDDDPETVDLTQEICEFEIENPIGKSLIDVMDQQDALDVNETIADLLETSVRPLSGESAKKDRSTKFHESNGLSDSLLEIMRKYGGESKKENSRSFRKIQSESQLVNESVKSRKSVQFDLDDDDDVVDLTQPLDIGESMKESSSINFDKSIHKSLENIIQYSPAVQRKRVQQKRSLGVQIDDDYIVDTESIVPEPEYRNMTPVELKQELFKYGIRALPVKKAVELLEFIYDQLNPKIRAAADEEIDVNDSRRELNITDIATNIGVQDFDEFVFQPGLVDDEEFVLPKIKKSKGATCPVPLHISFYNMVRSNEKIQKFILEYRPVELDQIHKHFRKFGLSYELNDIIAFLDRRCITFKTKEKSLAKTHEKKKLKRAQKSQKQTQRSQK